MTKTAMSRNATEKTGLTPPRAVNMGSTGRRGQSCLLGSALFCECLYNGHTQLRLRP